MGPTLRRLAVFFALAVALLLVAGCGGGHSESGGYLAGDRPPDNPNLDLASISDAEPRAEKKCSGCNNSYSVNGRRYHPLSSGNHYVERGIASWYGQKFHGRATASGERYDMYLASAAHRTLPLPSYARVTNLNNGRSLVVKVNDRGPFVDNRLIDLSYAAAVKLGIAEAGTGLVEVRAINPGQPPVTPPVATGSAALYLQVGAFRDTENARRLQNRLQQEGFSSVRIQRDMLWGAPISRVQIGPLESVPSADQTSARLTGLGHESVRVIVE